jgi:cell division inhibitor SepF
MSALHQKVARGFRNLWNQAEDVEEYEPEEEYEPSEPAAEYEPEPSHSRGEKYPKFTSAPSASKYAGHGGGSGSHLRKMPPLGGTLRSSREKNIYTLKPKSMDEVSLAADYLKTGCAVVLNLSDVERFVAVRVVDFMSGVCYGLESQGHAMKLGDSIFLFTPGDFEISSDETDYAENRDLIFRDIVAAPAAPLTPEPVVQAPAATTAYRPERHSWER